MTKKVLIISLYLSAIVTLLLSPLYLHHGFWKNWDEKRAYVEFFNQGSVSNSLKFEKASKSVQVSYPATLKNVADVDKSGQGLLMAFKSGPFYREQNIQLTAVGSGRLIINFQPQHKEYARVASLKTGQIRFFDISLGKQKLPLKSRFVKRVRDGERIVLSFQAKKVFSLWEMLCHIDWLMFIIAFSLSFFLALLVVRYLSRFKIDTKASRIDIVFLSGFFVFLMLPLSHISEDGVSEQEGRVFSPHPRLWGEETLNYQYGRQFEKWFNDHFFGRNWFISFYNGIQNAIGGKGNKKVLIGQQDWLYIADSSAVSMYQNMNLFSEKELQTAGNKMQEFVDEAHRHGVKDVYFYFSPDKETLYPEFYPTYITKQGESSRLQQFLAFLQKEYPQLKVMSYAPSLQKIKKKGEQLFCKTGSHMTGIGSYYEYLLFMRGIKKDYPFLKILSGQDVSIQEAYDCDTDLYRMLNDKNYSKRNAYHKNVIIKDPKAEVIEGHYRFNQSLGDVHIYTNKEANNHLKLLFLTDSFGLRWKQYLAETFASVYNIFTAHGADYTFFEDELTTIKNYKPDIIVVESTERFLQRFLNLEFPKI